MKRSTIIESIIVLYTILFVYTGVSKLMEFSIFSEQLEESPILRPIAPMIAFSLPWIEFLTVLMLIIPRWRLKGFYSILSLMAGFTIYVICLLTLNDKLPCSCGGILAQLSWPQHLIFNVVFISFACWAIFLLKRQQKEMQTAWNGITHSTKNTVIKEA